MSYLFINTAKNIPGNRNTGAKSQPYQANVPFQASY